MADSPSALSTRIGARVRAAREATGLSQQELAERASLDPASLSRIERGRAGLHVDTVERLAAALRVPVAALLDEDASVRLTSDVHRAELLHAYDALPPSRRDALLIVARTLLVDLPPPDAPAPRAG
ncbi:MAG: Helix-turn-helix domain [Pseudomonadota bacterium]